MPGTTPIYNLPYDSLTDPPDGADMGEDLADAVEAELARIDAEAGAGFPLTRIAHVAVTFHANANTPTSADILWGKTLPGTVYAFVSTYDERPGDRIIETSATLVTSTGCRVWAYRTFNASVTLHVLGIGI